MEYFVFILVTLNSVTLAYVVVDTTNGPVIGYSVNVENQTVTGLYVSKLKMFLGIPYAEPPVGQRRFARPIPKQPWKPQTLNATKFAPACPQPLTFLKTYSFASSFSNIAEDCLYLNVYAPVTESTVQEGYPVMVWIHGGSYRYGSGAEYDGRILALNGVIVVTINYRLGVFGFMSTDDSVASGNYGLLDQILALQWVQNNIRNFGGDPNRVTIFGQSAGGGSVSLHMFSPLAKGLFSAVIPQSGCALSPWAIYRPPHKVRTYSNNLARAVHCTTSSSATMVSCLRGKTMNELLQPYVGMAPMISAFAPRVDGYYILDLPENLLSRGEFIRNVTVMAGFVPQELAEDLGSVHGITVGMTPSQLHDTMYSKSRRYLSNADQMYRAMKCAYPSSNIDRAANRDAAIRVISDYGYVVPHIKLAEQLTKWSVKVWIYNFTYRSENSNFDKWMGVPHAEELYYEFGAPFWDSVSCPGLRTVSCPSKWGKYHPWSQEDRDVSLDTMAIWTDFAKQKNATGTLLTTSQAWPRFVRPSEVLLNISSTTTTAHLYKTTGIKFWESFNYLNLSEPVPSICQQGVVVG